MAQSTTMSPLTAFIASASFSAWLRVIVLRKLSSFSRFQMVA
jgi:hypothetical protein